MVDPVVEGTRLTKVLMDGGSGLHILYAETLKGMGIQMSRLSTSNMSFHGVILGKKAESLGQIALDVVFGDSKNYRKEKLTFEVVDFQSAYPAILGRPAYVLRKKRSSSSSVRTGTSSHGSLLTCLEFPGGWLSTVCESTQK